MIYVYIALAAFFGWLGWRFLSSAFRAYISTLTYEAFHKGLKAGDSIERRRIRELEEENSDLKIKLIAAEELAKGEIFAWAKFVKGQKDKALEANFKRSIFQTCVECGESWGEHKPYCVARPAKESV